MRGDTGSSTVEKWVRQNFGGLELGDSRLSRRAMQIAERMISKGAGSIPRQMAAPKDVKATYRFFSNKKVTPDGLQAGHKDAVREKMATSPIVLLIEDTSEFTWSGKEPVEGLGPVGGGGHGQQGFHLHSVLATNWPQKLGVTEQPRRPPLEIIGLAHQEFYIRQPRPQGEGRSSRDRKHRLRESQLWTRSSFHLGPAPQGIRWVRIADRGADIYELLDSCLAFDHGFVIRASSNRSLEDPQTGNKCGRLFEVAQKAPRKGTFEIVLRKRGRVEARTARLAVHATKVLLRSPQRPGHGAGYDPAIPCSVIWVAELNPPSSEKAKIEWYLLCDGEVDSYEEAIERVLQYASRWIIEEYHKGIKTGMGAEKLQLDTAEALFAAISMMAIVACRIIDLRDALRFEPDAPAARSGFDDLELEILARKTGRELRTVREVALALGRMGGHLGRKGDGLPGWLTLWRGLYDLRLLVEGVRLAIGLGL